MIGVIEHVKNSVLMKCNNLNDNFIAQDLQKSLDKNIYQFAESLANIIVDINIMSEEDIRSKIEEYLKVPITKKIKRKLFIDSLAIQITNDSYIEDYVNKQVDINDINKKYLKELTLNKKSNQLNMTEDLDLTEIIQKLTIYIDTNIISKVSENKFVVDAIYDLIRKTKSYLEEELAEMIVDLDNRYLNILLDELKKEVVFEDKNDTIDIEEERGNTMMPEINDYDYHAEEENVSEKSTNPFESYDDMTLYNKMILGLNTKEEKLLRCERKLAEKKSQIEKLLEDTNKRIERNIERENILSQRRIELSSREKELNTRLSEAEVIFLNMKPLIKGLNNIRAVEEGGDLSE